MRKNLIHFFNSRPLWAIITVGIAWHAALFAFNELIPPLQSSWMPNLGVVIVNLCTALVTLVFIVYLQLLNKVGLGFGVIRRWWIVVVPVILDLSYLVNGITGSMATLGGLAILVLVAAFSEELYSRGLSQSISRPLGYMYGAIAVGLVFGIGHMLSTLYFGKPIGDGILQVLAACASGFCFAAMRWHLASIWPLVVIHAYSNFMQFSTPGTPPIWQDVAIGVLQVAYGVWLLSGSRLKQLERRS